MKITVKCPECGQDITISLFIVDRLNAEIESLKTKIFELENIAKVNNLFGSIFKNS